MTHEMDPMSPLLREANQWAENEAQDFWRALGKLAQSLDQNDTIEITPKHARLLLYAAGS